MSRASEVVSSPHNVEEVEPANETDHPKKRTRRTMFDAEQFFGHQPTSSVELPDPIPLVENLTRSVLEVLAGARDLEQLSRWISHDVYMNLLKRTVLSTRARQAKGSPARRPVIARGSVHTCEPADGVIEAATVASVKHRARVVAIRLEGIDGRWRASALAVL